MNTVNNHPRKGIHFFDGGFDKLNHRGDAAEVTELVEVTTARHSEAA